MGDGEEGQQGRLSLPEGVKEKVFIDAVQASGYPLQIVVGTALSERGFELEEEWAFEDADSGERRAIDIAARQLSPAGPVSSERGTSELSTVLLIECKQSRHPYVFFESVAPPELGEFPSVSGLGAAPMRVIPPDDGGGARQVPLVRVLGVDAHPFVAGPPVAASLSRANVNGRKVSLSGEEPYRSLLLPLTKALASYRRQWLGRRSETFDPETSFDIRVPLAMAVIDAPMIFVGRPAAEPSFENVEWTRLIVRHPVTWSKSQLTGRLIRGGGGFSVVDVVHRSYMESFLDGILGPFAGQLFSRVEELHDEVLLGEMTARSD